MVQRIQRGKRGGTPTLTIMCRYTVVTKCPHTNISEPLMRVGDLCLRLHDFYVVEVTCAKKEEKNVTEMTTK